MRIIFTFAFIFLNSSLMASASLEFFYQHGCDDCEKVEKLIFPQLDKDVRIVRIDTSDEDNFLKLIAYLDKFKNSSNETVYIVVNGKYLFAGYRDIEKRLLPEISSMRDSADGPENKDAVRKRSSTMTFLTVLSAGLLDGINPLRIFCACVPYKPACGFRCERADITACWDSLLCCVLSDISCCRAWTSECDKSDFLILRAEENHQLFDGIYPYHPGCFFIF